MTTAEIPLIEDNPDDAKRTIHALRNSGIANNTPHTADGTTVYSPQRGANRPDVATTVVLAQKAVPVESPEVAGLQPTVHHCLARRG